MPRFGNTKILMSSPRRAVAIAMSTLVLTGCLYGFKGGGLPSHVKTIAVVPFENETPVTDLQRELSDSLRARLVNRLGLREASESRASAVVRGNILRYTADIPVGYDATRRTSTTAQRMLEIVLDIEVADQVTGKTLWARKSYIVQGQYNERQEARGRSQALDRIVNAIVEGAQSQW
jgi:hypothetical protein